MALSALIPSRRTLFILAGVLVAIVVVIAGARHHDRAAAPAQPTVPAGQVDFTGTGDIHFGDTSSTLARQHGLVRKPGDCGPTLPDAPQVSPVFVDDKLALLWVNAPLHTPEGITVGSPVHQVRAVYPNATDLPAPGADRYPGIMVVRADRAYLFLYADDQVQKVIVGLKQYVEDLYQSGGDTC